MCYSKCKLCKVLSQKMWGQSPNTHKMFSQNIRPKSYDYHDYIDTWYYTFFFHPFDHSWFFHQGDEIKNQNGFSNWFQEWWLFFGAIKDIFNPQILDCYKYFTKHGSHLIPNFLFASIILPFKISNSLDSLLGFCSFPNDSSFFSHAFEKGI